MHNKQHMCKIMAIGLFVMLVLAAAIPVLAAKLPVSKTAEQEVLEEKKDLEEAVTADESVPVPLEVAVENLPEDTTPRYSLSQIIFSGNTLFSDEQLLSNVPDLFNASRVAVVEPDNLYDLRPVKAIVAEPNAIQEVSARTIQGFTQYILSIYQKKHYAGIYVYLPGEAFFCLL
ncbi:MAG: hypothetical protein ACYSSK_00470 [Planctomycetota bacterium]